MIDQSIGPAAPRHRADGLAEQTAANGPRVPRRRAGVIAVGAAALFLGGAAGAIQVWPTTYAATSVVSFAPKPTAMAPADTMQLVGQKYVVIATSPAIMQAAGDALGISADDLADTTTAALSPASANLELVVVRPDREQAVLVANTIAALVVARGNADELTVAEQTSSAVASQTEVKPPRWLLRVLSAAAAALLGLVVWTVLIGRARTGPDVHPAPAAPGAAAPVRAAGLPERPAVPAGRDPGDDSA